jgi:hypothetical protein
VTTEQPTPPAKRHAATARARGGRRGAAAEARLRALVAAQLAGLRRHLARAARGDDRGVHEARKTLQRLRAVVMLFAPSHPEIARDENVRLRTLRRRLGPLRDAAVRAETLRLLATRPHWRPWRETLLQLAAMQMQAHAAAWRSRGPGARYWQLVGARADALAERARRWPCDGVDSAAAREACARSAKRVRKALKRALGEHAHAKRHDLRRRLRRHANLRRVVVAAFARKPGGLEALLALVKRCGHEGDLWLAANCARRAGAMLPQFRTLAREIEKRRRRMCDKHDRELRRLAPGAR